MVRTRFPGPEVLGVPSPNPQCEHLVSGAELSAQVQNLHRQARRSHSSVLNEWLVDVSSQHPFYANKRVIC